MTRKNVIVWISANNSSDRLSQVLWSEFIKNINIAIESHEVSIIVSQAHTSPTSYDMSCHWCIEIEDGPIFKDLLKNELQKIVRVWKANQIMWAEIRSLDKVPETEEY